MLLPLALLTACGARVGPYLGAGEALGVSGGSGNAARASVLGTSEGSGGIAGSSTQGTSAGGSSGCGDGFRRR